ncbi:hypothetical protein DL98DRAFT_582414 [Cadophora sp. DSE1049]|nr:hypothetical protein DL98DRAFT_582414 [Cadophora sp. DSE1049]
MPVVTKPALLPTFNLALFQFRSLPYEIRIIIWEHTADDPRYIEVTLKNGHSRSPRGEDHAYAYFQRPSVFHSLSPAGLRVCRESRHAVLRFFSILELGTGNAERKPDIEYFWMDPEDSQTVLENKNAKRVLFNPFVDTMVLQAGHVLHKEHGFLENIPKLKPLPRTDCVGPSQRSRSPSPPIKHLATSLFPWDMSEGLPRRPDILVEAFPELETLCVIGQRNDECECGYCAPSIVEDPEGVKKQVVGTIETVVENKNDKEKETVCKVPDDVRVVDMNVTDPKMWWTGITDLSWNSRTSLPDLRRLHIGDSNLARDRSAER